MAGIAHNQGFDTIMIGGVRDHIHALLLIPPIMALAKAVQVLKGSSSKWINDTKGDFSWQEGYGAFSVSASQTPDVVRYIANQRSHHEKRSFEEEFLGFLKKYAVNYDPIHVLG
jgi:REP element-mobilizing transposase RayT